MRYLILAFLLSACSVKSSKPTHFVCLTAFGPGQIDSDSPGVKITKDLIITTDDARTIVLHRDVCIEVTEK